MRDIEKGERLFAEGKIEEAEKCFLEILNQDSQNKEIHNDLGVIAYQRQDFEQATNYLVQSLEIDSFYKDAVINLSNVLRTLNQLHEAVSFLEKITERYPEDQEILRILEDARSLVQARPKIAVLCLPGFDSFLGDIVNFLSTSYEAQTCYGNNGQEIESTIRWADIIWLEWADELAISLTNHPNILNGKKVICRLHSYEAFAGYVQRVKWERINDLIFVAEHIKSIVINQAPRLPELVENIHIVPNGINMDKLIFKQRKKGWNLAYLGNINFKKGPMLLLHAFRELVQTDNHYHLSIAGVFQDVRYDLYFGEMIKEMGLERNIHLDGWVKDINAWLNDKQYIVCTSVLEGHPVGLMEAMACGLKPVIHSFVGAKGIYPKRYLWNTIPEFINKITEPDYDSVEYRKFIEEHYNLEKQLDKVEKIIANNAIAEGTTIQLDINRKKKQSDIVQNHSHDSSPSLKNSKEKPSVNDFQNDIVPKSLPENPNKTVSEDDVKSYYNRFLDHLKHDHEFTNPRHQKAKETLKNMIRPGMRVLDIGCGTGITSWFMGELGANVVGVDISDKLIEFARNNSAHQNVRYLVADATQLDLKERFDAITIIDSMEHILPDKLDDYFQAISRHVSEETIIYVNIPDGRYQRYLRVHHPSKLQIVDEGYDPDLLVSLLKKIGFQPYYISIYGLDVPIQYNEYLFMPEKLLEQAYTQALKKLGL